MNVVVDRGYVIEKPLDPAFVTVPKTLARNVAGMVKSLDPHENHQNLNGAVHYHASHASLAVRPLIGKRSSEKQAPPIKLLVASSMALP